MLLDLVEYITIEETPRDLNSPRKVHIYYKFLDKAPYDMRNVLINM